MRACPAVAFLVLFSTALPVSAQVRRLGELREALRDYDTGPEGTTRIIESLGLLARRLHDPSAPLHVRLGTEARAAEAREARFLRAVVTADLLLLARRRGEPELRRRLAAAYGVPTAELASTLRSDLERLRSAPYEATIDDVMAALFPPRELQLPDSGIDHVRRQAAFFTRMFDALLSTDDPTDMLAGLADDPCSAAAECPPPYAWFGSRSRRAIAAMTHVQRILGSVEQTGQLGDPFSAALAREVLVDAVILRSIHLVPRDWGSNVAAVDMEARGDVVDADAVVVVAPDHVRIGWVPHVEWDSTGHPIATAAGRTFFDAASRFSVHVDPRTVPRPLDGLAEELAEIASAERVAVVLEPGVEAHQLSRVLASLDCADIRPRWLAGADHRGTVRGLDFEVVRDGSPPVGVFVRLGGLTAWQPGERVSLPRVREDDGWRFDLEGLEQATAQRVRRAVGIRYMATAPASLVLRVALRVAPPNRPLQLVLR